MQLYDLDHVTMKDGRIFRVLGNFDSVDNFLGYNVYSPDKTGDRMLGNLRYSKNFLEDQQLPDDVFATYDILAKKDIVSCADPITSAKTNNQSFKDSVWFDLYRKLVELFGEDYVGIFGSSMFNLHLTPEGTVRKDIDFVIEGLDKIAVLEKTLPIIRESLGFREISAERQLTQYERYKKVFKNEHNSIQEIIARRWTGLQLSEQVVSTLRFRDPNVVLPFALVDASKIIKRNIKIKGTVVNAKTSNLFPRMFTILTEKGAQEVYLFWWKFSTPVREGDHVTLCGDHVALGEKIVLRMSNFREHWIHFPKEG